MRCCLIPYMQLPSKHALTLITPYAATLDGFSFRKGPIRVPHLECSEISRSVRSLPLPSLFLSQHLLLLFSLSTTLFLLSLNPLNEKKSESLSSNNSAAEYSQSTEQSFSARL